MSEPKTIMSWGCCNQEGDDKENITCIVCDLSFHLACLATTNSQFSAKQSELPSDWKCPLCFKKPRGVYKDNTPVRASSSSRAQKRVAPTSSPQVDLECPLTRDDVRTVVQEIFSTEMDNLFIRLGQQMRSIITTETAPMKQDIQDLQESMAYTSGQCEENTKKGTEIIVFIKKIQDENVTLREENRNLSVRINQLEQHARSNNVEIQCVPEKVTENLVQVVSNLMKTVSCDVKEECILNCTRIAKLNPTSTRPRSIVVQLSSPRARDTLIASAIKYNRANPNNRLNSSHIGFVGEKSPIFIVEHLSASNKALHAAARTAAKEKNYKFVWVRNGRIYMRKSETSDHKLIKDLESLQKLD